MKHLLFAIFMISFIMGIEPALSGQPKIIPDPLKAEGMITINELKPSVSKVHPLAKQAIANGEKPGEFKNVSYQYAPNVKALTSAQKAQMVMKQDGILELPSSNIFIPHPDTVYVDPESDLIFRSEVITDKQMLMIRPKLSEVFEDINIL